MQSASRFQCRSEKISYSPSAIDRYEKKAEGCQTRQAPVQMRSCEFLENVFNLQMLAMFGEAGGFSACVN